MRNQIEQMGGRRDVLRGIGVTAGIVALGGGFFAVKAFGAGTPIKVGVVTDLTGPISYAGEANANVAKLLVDDLNAHGGLLGRRLELILADSASDPAIGQARAEELIRQHDPDIILGGITSAARDAMKGPIVDGAQKLYIYPELYEGGECHPRIFCTGPTPQQQVDQLVPWLLANGGKRFYLPASDYVWPHGVNQAVRAALRSRGADVVGEEYFSLDATEFSGTVDKIMSSDANVVFNTVIPPGVGPLLAQLHAAGFGRRGGRLVCPYFDENLLNVVPAEHMEGLANCLDYFEAIEDPFSRALAASYRAKFGPQAKRFAAGSAATGMYRGIAMWANAVKEAGTLETNAVRAALDHAKIDEGPGGPAQMVPGEHHVRMHMYIAVAKQGRYEIVRKLGMTEPRQCSA